MSNTFARSWASGSVKRSNRSVAIPRARSAEATCRFRGLSRLLPLPWAKATTPAAPSGTMSSPGSTTEPSAGIPRAASGSTMPPAIFPDRGRAVPLHSLRVSGGNRYGRRPSAAPVEGKGSESR